MSEEMEHDDRGGNQSGTAAKECPGVVATTRSAEKGIEQMLPSEFQGERGPADTVVSDFQSPEL